MERLIAGYDVIVDGTDNFDTRYVLNDAAVKLRKPVVHGSIYRWDGQVTTFVPFEGPCYRCMYPTQPPDELAPACSVAGVLGVLPGIVGMLQANEVFKLVLGVGETLAGRLLMFDAMGTTFDEVRIWRDPACPACGEGVAVRVGDAASRRGTVGGDRMSTIRIPPVLRENTGGSRTVDVTGGTVAEALDDLFGKHPALRDRVTEEGELSAASSTSTSTTATSATATGWRPRSAPTTRSSSCPPWPEGRARPMPTTVGAAPDLRGRHRQHADGRAAAPGAARRRAAVRQAGGQQPDRQRQGPRRAGDDRVRPSPIGSLQPGPDDPRAVERQHRDQPGDDRRRGWAIRSGSSCPTTRPREREQLLRLFGAEIVFSPGAEGSNGAIRLAQSLAEADPSLFMPYQYGNEANPRAHEETTGPEILAQVPDVDVFVAGLGTGGTLTGVGRYLKRVRPGVRIVAAEPLPGEQVQGLRSLEEGFVPPVLDESVLDDKVLVSNRDAVIGLRRLLREEGIFAGLSCGAAVAVAVRVAREMESGSVVVLLADGGWKYLSADLWSRDLDELEDELEGSLLW